MVRARRARGFELTLGADLLDAEGLRFLALAHKALEVEAAACIPGLDDEARKHLRNACVELWLEAFDFDPAAQA